MSNASNGDLIMEQMANAGQLMCIYACCFPPSDEMAEIIPRGVGGPMALGEASTAWKAGASALQEVQNQLRELTAGLTEDDWSGDDRDAFDTTITDLLAELGDSHNTAEAIGITLEVLSPLMAVWPPLCLMVGGAMAAVATGFYAAAATGIADITGVSEEIYAAGLEISETMLGVMEAASTVLATALGAAQAVIAGAVITDVAKQQGHGDTAIAGDLGQAEVDGLGQVAINAAQFGFTKAIGKIGKGEGESGEGENGGGETSGETNGGETDGGGEDGQSGGETDGGEQGSTSGSGEDSGTDGDSGADGSGDDGSGADKSGDESDPPTAQDGYERGQGRGGRVAAEAGRIGADTANKQTADRGHAGAGLQELINDMSGWSGPQ